MFSRTRRRVAGSLAVASGFFVFSNSLQAGTITPPFGNQIKFTDNSIFDGSTTLDLGTHDLLVFASDSNRTDVFAWLEGFIISGRNGGTWDGPGINSSAAAANSHHTTGLAAIINDDGNGNPLYTNFDGQSVDKNTIILKYTWNGDADLTGKVDADDYFLIDRAYVTQVTNGGYYNGDFDYNGVVDGDDYFLIDCANLRQTGVLSDANPLIAFPVGAPTAPPSVPLPTSLASGMFLLGGIVLVRRFKR